MKSMPIVFTGLAALAAAESTTITNDKRAGPGATPSKEQLCVGFNNDFVKCQAESEVCFKQVQANGQEFTWDKMAKCLAGRLPAPTAAAAPAPTTKAEDKPAAGAAAAGTTPTKEQLCVGFKDDFAKCQKETEKCIQEIKDNGQDFSWDKVSKCLAVRRPPPTKEELCVGFNGDFETCQRETGVCFNEIKSKEEFTWEKVSKCLEGRLQNKAGVAPPQNNNKDTNKDNNKDTAAATASKADIRVDTNRDGIVDVDGTSDQAGKDTWTDAAGAIFLPNIADSGDRCKKLHTGFSLPKQLATLYDTLSKCHDASDDEQHAPQNLAPMRTMPITGLGDSATGTITIADERSRGLVRVFRETKDGKWEIVNNDTVFSAADLAAGLTLGVDARDTRRADWDGRVKVDFTVKDGQTSTDSVMLRVAPVLLHHHKQAVTDVFTSDFPAQRGLMKAYLNTIIDGIQASMKAAGIARPLTRLATNDVWAQDYFEPAYASMPGPNGTVVALRVVIEGRHDPKHNATSVLYTAMRGDGVGVIAQKLPRQADLSKRSSDFDAGGNLESLPPHEHNGKKYPAGRIIVGGGDSNEMPIGMDFFKAQEAQAPLVLDSTWLSVKHVDEMVQAVPANTERGWAIMVVDAEMGLKMLRDAGAAGLGKQRVISRSPVTGPTIAAFLRNKANTDAAEEAAKAMAANIEILKKETGLTDAEIHRVPALISPYELTKEYAKPLRRRRGISTRDEAAEAALDQEFLDKFPSHVPEDDNTEADETTDEKKRRQAAPPKAKPPRFNSVLPSLVNGVPLSATHYLAPKPFGTVIDGKDIFEEATTAAYKKAGFTTVEYLEEWRIHAAVGDLHCMSNTYRDTSEPWW